MKTTNYQISKQLAEVGFKTKSIFGWHVDGKECAPAYPLSPTATGYFWSYDLETILEALPNFIANKNKGENCLIIDVAFGEIHYEGDSDNDAMFITTTGQNESLADTAAIMWLKLKENNLI